jgi:hypothetical protein
MPVSYFDQLKAQLTESATAKKAALDAAYDRATAASFDAAGNVSYKKDASGNNIYGTRDVQYLEQKRTIGANAEGSGTLRSGQNQRNLINNDANYRSDLGTLSANLTTQKNTIDTDTATKSAEYQAMYGKEKTGSTSSSGSGSGSDNSVKSSKLEEPQKAPKPKTQSTVTNNGKTTTLTLAQQKAWANALRNVPSSRSGSRK